MFYGLSDLPVILVETTFCRLAFFGAMKKTSSVDRMSEPPSPIPNHVSWGKQARNSI